MMTIVIACNTNCFFCAVDRAIWQHVTHLYPALVQCVTCNSHDVRLALREALHQFTDLIQEQHSLDVDK